MSALKRLYLAHSLTAKKSTDDPEKLNDIIRSANIDLNPHQVEAAIFAFKSPLSRGAILADEVGLGKTIEAGLIINQLWVEGSQHIVILVPASLRTQWQDELRDRFYLDSIILDGPSLKKMQKERVKTNPLQDSGIYIASHNFAYRYDIYFKEIDWSLVVIDEAHRLRNVWRKSNKTAKKIREVIKGLPKILLTATPLQNNLMELFGLASFIDENYLGTDYSFKTLFVHPVTRYKKYDRLDELKERLMGNIDKRTGDYQGGILTRTLRKQVRGFVSFTNRYSITEDFKPNDDEMELYNSVSEYLARPFLASTKVRQRNMMELVYRKILASSSFAIAGTLGRVANFLAKRLQEEFKISYEEIVDIVDLFKKDLENQQGKKLPVIKLDKIEKSKDLAQEILPGFNDLELNATKVEEESEDADDLGEDELFADEHKKIAKKSLAHEFTKEEIINELKDVLSYYFLASTISVNQKSQALVRVLDKVFKYAEKKNWPQKAVIFTESRRTQDHLEKLLFGLGYELVLFNGSNAGKKAKDIFKEWAEEFPAEAERGSRGINLRKALIWKFQQLKKAILITTEAGAEGLNLQFANIVINYDLPWNPQRIEQRIGRCHRYGQKLDVLVINFLNKRNYADQRVYELLKEKIKLFGNLFDFTDKVLGTERITDDGYEVREVALGALGAGLDFERKILDIYRNCRTEQEIEKSFKQLQLELQDVIEEKIVDTQKKVLQHFDQEVRQKLKIRDRILKDSLTKFDSDLKTYLQVIYGNRIKFLSDNIFQYQGIKYILGKATTEQRELGYLPVHTNIDLLKFNIKKDRDISGKWNIIFVHPKGKERKSHEDFIGKEGQLIIDLLTAKRKTVNNGDEIFEKIIVSAMFNDGDSWKKIDIGRAKKIMDLNIIKESRITDRLRDELIDYAKHNTKERKKEITEENEEYVLQEIDLLNKFTEEALLKHQNEIHEREKGLKDMNKKLKASKTMGYHEIQQVQEQINKKQKELLKAQKKYFEAQEAQFKQKDNTVAGLRNKLQMNYEVRRLAEIKFIIKR